jgi:RND family efflux transporter MFP subunit
VPRSPFHHAILIWAVTTGACKSERATPALPPATGQSAPARPAFPAVTSSAAEATTTGAASDATTGTTVPVMRAEIGPNASGVIEQIAVSEGQRVRKGALLFRLRGQDAALAVRNAQATLKSAQVRQEAVRVEYERTRRLFEQRAVDQAQWDRVQAEWNGAAAVVEQAQVGLDMARRQLADLSVYAPIDGVVTAKLKQAGERVTTMPPTVVLLIENHAQLELRFRMPERALSALREGDTVEASFDALGETRSARIARISPSVDARTRTVEVVAAIDNRDGRLKSGMLAKLRLTGVDAARGDAAPAAARPGETAAAAPRRPAVPAVSGGAGATAPAPAPASPTGSRPPASDEPPAAATRDTRPTDRGHP